VTPITTRALSLTAPKRDNCPSPLPSVKKQAPSNVASSSDPSEMYVKKIGLEETVEKMESKTLPKAGPKNHDGSAESFAVLSYVSTVLRAVVTVYAILAATKVATGTLQVWHATKVVSVQGEVQKMEERVYTKVTKDIAVHNGNEITAWKSLRYFVRFGVSVFCAIHGVITGAIFGVMLKMVWTAGRLRLWFA